MDEVYQPAAYRGGAGYIFTGENDAKAPEGMEKTYKWISAQAKAHQAATVAS